MVIDKLARRSSGRSLSRGGFNHYGVLALSLLLTLGAAVAFDRAGQDRDLARFTNAVQSTTDRVERRIDAYIALLRATGSYYEVEAPDLQQYRRYIAALDLPQRYPGMLGIGVSLPIAARDKTAFEHEMRRQGQAGFRVWPSTARDEYQAIALLEPMNQRNAPAIGYDMSSEPVRREAMQRARRTQKIAASRAVTLVQGIDTPKQAGFLIYMPMYAQRSSAQAGPARQEHFLGYVYGRLRADDLFARIFGSEQEPRVAFEVYDGAATGPRQLLHRSERRAASRGQARFQRTVQIDVAGTPWTIDFHSTAALEETSARGLLPALVAIGLLGSFALFMLARAQATARAEATAQQRLAEAERNNLRALFMQAPAAVAILKGKELRYELSNSQNDRFAGGQQLEGKTVHEALPGLEAQGLSQTALRVMETGEPWIGNEAPVTLSSPEGEATRTVYLNGVYQPLRGPAGDIDGILTFAYEVTEQVLARRELENVAAELARAVRVRDDFLSIAGHELKTPLAALTLALQVLLRNAERGVFITDNARLLERLTRAVQHTARLDRLIAELLDVSKITAGRLTLQLEDVDLTSLAGDLIERFSEQSTRAGLVMSLHAEQRVVGHWDRLRIEQVLTNLLSNAIKYAPGKPVEITVARHDGHAQLTVTDHGIGIPMADQERVFERFERAVSERNYGGMGLGLWISRQIVQSHGGHIAFESVPDDHTSFIVDLPLSVPQSSD